MLSREKGPKNELRRMGAKTEGARVVEAERGLTQGHTREGQRREECTLKPSGGQAYIHVRCPQAEFEAL